VRLVQLLRAVEQALPKALGTICRPIVLGSLGMAGKPPLEASFTVLGFCAL